MGKDTADVMKLAMGHFRTLPSGRLEIGPYEWFASKHRIDGPTVEPTQFLLDGLQSAPASTLPLKFRIVRRVLAALAGWRAMMPRTMSALGRLTDFSR